MTPPYEERLERCRDGLEAVGAEAMVLFPGPNLYYLTGAVEAPSERHFLLVLPRDGEATFLVPEMSGEQVMDTTPITAVRTWADDDDPAAALESTLADIGVAGGRVLLDDHLWARFTLDVRAALPDAEFGLAGEVLVDLRMRKDGTELAAMREAASITDAVSAGLREDPDVAIGVSESALASEIDDRQREAGGTGPAFPTIVAAGENGARPHHDSGSRVIRPGDPVVLDFGTTVDCYLSDETRTMVFGGEPPEGFEAAFEAVLAAHEAGVEAVEPGATAEAVDLAARRVIEDRGFGEAFLHRTGHGVGLEIHEPPYIVEGNDRVLEPGMVFSVEPGVYLDGSFGVRIEDLVVVTGDGAERLNDSPRGWRVG